MGIKASRVRLINRAEQEILKYHTTDPEQKAAAFALWMKNICGQAMKMHQIFYADQLLRFPYVVVIAPPRGGKTFGTEAVDLYESATNPKEDGRIYVPKYDQGKDSLKYQCDWIDKSEVLSAYIRIKAGKRQFSTVGYEFENGSNWRIYSIRGEIEGHNVSIMRCEEFDDWPWERFQNDVLRRGGAKNENGQPTRVRITGVILGQENIYRLKTEPKFQKLFRFADRLPNGNPLDVHTLVAMGVLDPEFVKFQQEVMSPDEWLRSMCLQFTESKNFIWSSYLRAGQKKALEWGLEGVPYVPGGGYESSGVVAFGFDCGHAGEKAESSWYTLHIFEQVGAYRRWLNGFRWPPTYDALQLKEDIKGILAFYQPEGGYGDALKHSLIADINDELYWDGVCRVNREEFPDNTQGNWEKWWFAPLWNTDKAKHLYYTSLQQGIHSLRTFFPYFDRRDNCDMAHNCRQLLRSLEVIRQERTKGTYPRYYAVDSKIGDDDADAAAMANLWLDVHLDMPPDLRTLGSTKRTTVTSGLQTSVVGELAGTGRGMSFEDFS